MGKCHVIGHGLSCSYLNSSQETPTTTVELLEKWYLTILCTVKCPLIRPQRCTPLPQCCVQDMNHLQVRVSSTTNAAQGMEQAFTIKHIFRCCAEIIVSHGISHKQVMSRILVMLVEDRWKGQCDVKNTHPFNCSYPIGHALPVQSIAKL